MASKPISAVPGGVLLAGALALLLQLGWHYSQPGPGARADALTAPPPLVLLQLASLGDPLALARLTMLSLQADDDQPGISLNLRQLDYDRLAGWLERVEALDPRSQYPLLAASTVYSAVDDPVRQRRMLDLVYRAFSADPNQRWPWLAQAALIARHRLHDLPLARSYARAIRLQATGPGVPAWARELEVFMAEDMNELDSARTLIGALIASGQITDPHELRFLAGRLDQLAARQAAAHHARAGP